MTVLEIQEMKLRIPGLPPEQAQVIGRQVVRTLARRLERHSSGKEFAGLTLIIRVSEGQTPEQMTESIVQAILDQIEH